MDWKTLQDSRQINTLEMDCQYLRCHMENFGNIAKLRRKWTY